MKQMKQRLKKQRTPKFSNEPSPLATGVEKLLAVIGIIAGGTIWFLMLAVVFNAVNTATLEFIKESEGLMYYIACIVHLGADAISIIVFCVVLILPFAHFYKDR